MMRKYDKKGFTLVELIVVIAILSVVAGAIYTIMQMSIVTFMHSSDRVAAQSVARRALNDMKMTLGTAKDVDMSLDRPSTLPTLGGFIYFDTSNASFIVKQADGSSHEYAIDVDLASEVILYIDLIQPVDEYSDYNSLRITITIDSYVLTTDVFVQNLAEFGGKLTPDYDPVTALHPAQFVSFE